MLTRYSLMKNLRMVSVGLVLGSTLPVYAANIGACRQPTPHPCAADGVCRPQRETWGTYRNQWRPWPGDAIGHADQAAGPDVSGEAESLPGFQPPSAKDEDLRGPAKIKEKSSKDSEDSSDDALEIDAPAGGEALPALPGLDVQGQLFRSPSDSFAIPLQLPIAQDVALLPVAQEASAEIQHLPLPSQEFLGADPFVEISDQPLVEISDQPLPKRDIETTSQPRDQDLPPTLPFALRRMPASSTITATPTTKRRSQSHTASLTQRATWNQPSGIRLINPASSSVAQPDAGALKQAIYYEATDQSGETPTR